jgi:hypothetical protein
MYGLLLNHLSLLTQLHQTKVLYSHQYEEEIIPDYSITSALITSIHH